MLRIGSFSDVVRQLIQALNDNHHSVDAVWMTEDVSSEEVDDQEAVSAVCSEKSVGFKLWRDDKYFIDE